VIITVKKSKTHKAINVVGYCKYIARQLRTQYVEGIYIVAP